jgi:hypothetical protein
LAKVAAVEYPSSADTATLPAGAGEDELTGTGKVLGTLSHMSPEQIRSERLDPARICFRSALSFMRWQPESCHLKAQL